MNAVLADDRPAPMTPDGCDLTDFKFMPLDCQRLRDSDLASEQTPEQNWAAVLLWAASWHQVPAASLPDKDETIAKWAGYMMRGKVDPRWKEIRDGAMRGFVLCTDGRWYHPVVAEKANEAWVAKLRQRHRTECKRISKHNERHEMALPLPEFDTWMASGCPSGQPLPLPSDKAPPSPRQAPAVAGDTGGLSQRQGGDVAGDMASKGQGQGQGQGLVKGTSDEVPTGPAVPAGPAAAPPPPDEDDDPPSVPACPHREILRLWAELLPAMPQHDPDQWHKTREGNLRARWREAAVKHGWKSQADGLKFFAKLFRYVGTSPWLTGRVNPGPGRKPFVCELEWLIRPSNWAKVFEGKYHESQE